MKEYRGEYLQNIVYPLGGIGSGSIGFAGNGILVDPEIVHHPNREAGFENTGFSVKVEQEGKLLDSRMLFCDSDKDLSGTISGEYGRGSRRSLSGFRHFRNGVFSAQFPFGKLRFSDKTFPVNVSMEAFNPFIPSNDRDSSIPAAFFTISLHNPTRKALQCTVALSLSNMLPQRGRHTFSRKNGVSMLRLHSKSEAHTARQYGCMTAATDAAAVEHQDYWFRGSMFDTRTMFMNDFQRSGALENRVYDTVDEKKIDTGTLSASLQLSPGESGKLRFLIAWYVPLIADTWDGRKTKYFKTYYAALFRSSDDVAQYCFRHWDRLEEESRCFAEALSASSLPPAVADAIDGNLPTLKTTTCLRLEDGSFWAWEGVWRKEGSCMGNCQHVWNYTYALAHLFPKLERGIRDNELQYCMEPSGMLHFRMPIGRTDFWGKRACVDGQMGTVVKICREWKLSGDTAWLRSRWEQVKKCIAYAWSSENPDRWDPQKDGVISGRQHHTLDVELFGVHAWLTGFYHAALLAGEQMALALGDKAAAEEYRAIFERGQKTLDRLTYRNGYYVQDGDYTDSASIASYFGEGEKNTYWDEETRQVKYQIGDGCEVDQVVADWHADLIGLGHIFLPEHRKSALETVYQRNFRSMESYDNPCRVYACNREKGTVICTWQTGDRKPQIPIPYSQECMTGFEYAAACSMLQCGMEREALELTKAVRDRYDGKKRNPFAELEAGASYARAMACYTFLLTYSGFRYDLSRGMIGFAPLHEGDYFWSVDGAWGSVSYRSGALTVRVLYGTLNLKELQTPFAAAPSVQINGKQCTHTAQGGIVRMEVTLQKGDVVTVTE